jgi:branched-chain amino acid aminotransferase
MVVSFLEKYVSLQKKDMISTLDISIQPIERSKLNDLSLENIPFGKYFTDHMLEADFENGEWKNVEIKPFQPLLLSPSLSSLHYGQSIFEGIKAYRSENGQAAIFRPYENFKRFNLSALRMNMPEVPEEIFIEGMRQLIALDINWIPARPDHSLYIRPFMFASDTLLGVRPSDTYKFVIILSPTGPYYTAPMKIMVEENYTRACPGGVGFSKNAGNYGGSMLAATKAKEKGYDQVLWTDAFEHKWLQEVGMMNVAFVINNKIVTPSLEEGTILRGVTRDSAITLLHDLGMETEERPVHIDELIHGYKQGMFTEMFGLGTAATVAMIKELKYREESMHFDVDKYVVAPQLRMLMNQIKEGRVPDHHNWMFSI